MSRKREDSAPIVGWEDMIQMDDLTEQTLLSNLKIRYNSNLIYVCILYN